MSRQTVRIFRVAELYHGAEGGERILLRCASGSEPIQISGSGTREATVSCRRNLASSKLHTRYENGTNTIRFCGREVKLANEGRLTIVGDEVVELGEGKNEVIVIATAKE